MTARDDLSTRMAQTLVHHAARHAPAELAARLEEEWLADLAAQPGGLARLRFALGCLWARQVIAHDPLWSGSAARSTAAAGGTAVAHSAMVALAPGPSSPFSRRTFALLLIVGVHLLAIYGFIFGGPIAHKPKQETPPFLIRWIDQPTPPQAKPNTAMTHGTLGPWKAVQPDLTLRFDLKQGVEPPPDAGQLHIEGQTGPVSPIHRVTGGPGAGFPATADYYPPGAIRLEETGAATVDVCVDNRGRLSKDPAIATSSGSSRLDGGALALAKAGSGHYRSTTEDGKPVASCFAIRVRFNLDR
ncbi:MAG: Gram-negative bacterial TonB protein C-terminal [Pseudomonadota bacterium]|jgi:hypothetical protein